MAEFCLVSNKAEEEDMEFVEWKSRAIQSEISDFTFYLDWVSGFYYLDNSFGFCLLFADDFCHLFYGRLSFVLSKLLSPPNVSAVYPSPMTLSDVI